MNYTKGEWTVEGTDVRTRYPFVILGDGVVIARIEDEGNSGTPEANAHLIAAAVNACASVNPDNPMAVAESIKDMYEALKFVQNQIKAWTDFFPHLQPSTILASHSIENARAKAEGREDG